MLKTVLIFLAFHLCFGIKPIDKSRVVLEAVKEFCLVKREDFCSDENLKYMFWNKADYYRELKKTRQEFDQNQIILAKKVHKNGRELIKSIIKELFYQFSL